MYHLQPNIYNFAPLFKKGVYGKKNGQSSFFHCHPYMFK